MSDYQYLKEWRSNTKSKLVYALGSRCQICGYCKSSSALDLHHIDASIKERAIGSMISHPRSWAIIASEASKCVLLCANCHRELHAGEVTLPDSIQKFDESLIPTELLKLPNVTYCPMCGLEKLNCYVYCSKSCSAKAPHLNPFDWSKFDVVHLVEVEKMPYVNIAKLVGCSNVAVKKRYLKLKKMLQG